MVQTRSSSKKKGRHDVEDESRATGKPGLSLTSLRAPVVEDVVARDDVDEKPAKKRHKKNKDEGQSSKRSRRRGKLEMMPQMNLDVLFHIFSFLHPMDLLNLARTTKAFRQLLMQKSSAFIWKTSRLQLEDFPDCPADLSEPQYINLAFYPHCHNCGKIAQTIHWRIRRRYCPSCRMTRLCKRPYCDPFVRDWKAIPGDPISIGNKRDKEHLVDAGQLSAFLREYNGLPEDKTEEFVQTKCLQTTIIEEHARKCEDWVRQAASARKLEILDAQEARQDDIFNRLIDLGYESEIDYVGRGNIACSKSERAIFRSCKTLTDGEWNRVRHALVKKMEEYRKRAQEERVYRPRRFALVRRYDRYVHNLAPPGAEVDILPHVADVATFEPFAAIIYSSPEITLDDECFEPAFAQLPALVQEWREEIEAELASLIVIPSDSKKPMASQSTPKRETLKAIDRLRLASTVFINRHDGQLFTYPDVLYFLRFNQGFSWSEQQKNPVLSDLGAHTWSIYNSSRHPLVRYFTAAVDIVRVCGLDPELATVEDMEKRDARLVCNVCQNSFVRTWKNAVLHSQLHRRLYDKGEKVDWTLVDDRYLEDIKAAERALSGARRRHYHVRCLSCQRRVGDNRFSEWNIARHQQEVHGVKNLGVGVHWIYDRYDWPRVKEVRMIKEGNSVKFTLVEQSDLHFLLLR